MAITRERKKQLSRILHACTQRIPGICLILIVTLWFVGPPFVPYLYWSVVMLFHVFLVTNAVRLAVGLVLTTAKTQAYVHTNWVRRYEEFVERNGGEQAAVQRVLKPTES